MYNHREPTHSAPPHPRIPAHPPPRPQHTMIQRNDILLLRRPRARRLRRHCPQSRRQPLRWSWTRWRRQTATTAPQGTTGIALRVPCWTRCAPRRGSVTVASKATPPGRPHAASPLFVASLRWPASAAEFQTRRQQAPGASAPLRLPRPPVQPLPQLPREMAPTPPLRRPMRRSRRRRRRRRRRGRSGRHREVLNGPSDVCNGVVPQAALSWVHRRGNSRNPLVKVVFVLGQKHVVAALHTHNEHLSR